MPGYTCNLAAPTKPLPHVWEHTIGSGHAALALRADWQGQLARCRRELGIRYVRFHGLLCDPMDTLICQDERWLYSFFNTDRIMDYLLSIGMRPFVELSFMPDALASGGKTAFHYQANVTPPKDYGEWATLIGKLAQHWVHRYGIEEVRTWFFEVWNEPNLTVFGSGKQDDYFTLYKATAAAIKQVDASLRVGGPATANGEWIPDFVAYCDKQKLPADFVSTHQYPTDSFGKPGDDTETQLSLSVPGFMSDRAQKARDQAGGRQIYYTEWSTSSNPRDQFHDDPFAAAFCVNILMSVSRIVESYSYWTFSDIFDENYMPSKPFQGGFGLLSIEGVPKPAYRAYELLHRLGTDELPVEGTHDTVKAWSVKLENKVTVLFTNHALPKHPINTELVHMSLTGASAPRIAYVERVDQDHANAKRAWQAMGEPEYPSKLHIEQMEVASEMRREPLALSYTDNIVEFDIALPPHSVAAVTVEF
ncbi:MAG: beta-xylosidase [Gemmatimonadota bacterium]|nr:beta-xylosidase [Gemmatimonadota bacterium]